MADLGVQTPRLLIARNELGIAQQEIVIKKRALRLAEIAEEEMRAKAQIERMTASRDEEQRLLAVVSDKASSEALRHEIAAMEHDAGIREQKVRLLELDDERRTIARDVASSNEHIARLRAEIQQQTDRATAENNGKVT